MWPRQGRRDLIASPVALHEFAREGRQPLPGDGVAKALHQPLVEGQVVLGHQHRAEDFAGFDEMVEVGAAEGAQAGHGHPGSIGSGSSAWRALRRLSGPFAVNAWPLRPDRVGSTQSNMSTPRRTASTRSSGLPTPIR